MLLLVVLGSFFAAQIFVVRLLAVLPPQLGES